MGVSRRAAVAAEVRCPPTRDRGDRSRGVNLANPAGTDVCNVEAPRAAQATSTGVPSRASVAGPPSPLKLMSRPPQPW